MVILSGTVTGILVVPGIAESYSPHPVNGTDKYAVRDGDSAAWLTPRSGWQRHPVLGTSTLTLVSPDEALVVEVSLRNTTADEVFSQLTRANGSTLPTVVVEEILDSGLTLRHAVQEDGLLITIDTEAGLVVMDARVGTAVELSDYLPALGDLLETIVPEVFAADSGRAE
jgi:hypothetical protein